MTYNFGCGNLLSQKSKFGIYFHIPFCPHICPYCDFVKTSRFTPRTLDNYFEALLTQTKTFLKTFEAPSNSCTVYFGGGTPGLLDGTYYEPILREIQKKFHITECTIETNPFTNSKKKFSSYQKAGINRVTLGAQSLCNNTLKTLGRKHSADEVIQNIESILEANIKNIQVDLIYGLKPGTRKKSLFHEISTLVSAGATGISAYALTIETRTSFANSDWAHEETAVSEYEELYKTCLKEGLLQKETSNFSKYEAEHNNIYWYGLSYIGIGTGAHGLLPATRDAEYGMRYKIGVIDRQIAPADDDIATQTTENLFRVIYDDKRTRTQYLDELIFTMLRTPHGLPLDEISKVTGSDAKTFFLKDSQIQRALEEKKLILQQEFLQLDWHEKIRGDSWALHLSWLKDKMISSQI